jgi:hypothetical protein
MIGEAETNPINTEVVRQALRWANLKNNPVMLYKNHGGMMPEECTRAIKTLEGNLDGFNEWLQDQLAAFPLIKNFFGDLILARLKQQDILECPFFRAICDDSSNLESRLERIQAIPGIEELKKEYHSSNNPADTDRAILNLSTEVLILDFMLQLGFTGIYKVPKQNKAHVDFVGCRDGKSYAIEVTRKKKVKGLQTVPYGNLEDPDNPHNQEKISDILWNTLLHKNRQFSRALTADTIDTSMIKVVAIRTSDFGFAQCVDAAQRIAGELLMQDGAPAYVDCVWLVPYAQVTESRWICKKADEVLQSPSRL